MGTGRLPTGQREVSLDRGCWGNTLTNAGFSTRPFAPTLPCGCWAPASAGFKPGLRQADANGAVAADGAGVLSSRPVPVRRGLGDKPLGHAGLQPAQSHLPLWLLGPLTPPASQSLVTLTACAPTPSCCPVLAPPTPCAPPPSFAQTPTSASGAQMFPRPPSAALLGHVHLLRCSWGTPHVCPAAESAGEGRGGPGYRGSRLPRFAAGLAARAKPGKEATSAGNMRKTQGRRRAGSLLAAHRADGEGMAPPCPALLPPPQQTEGTCSRKEGHYPPPNCPNNTSQRSWQRWAGNCSQSKREKHPWVLP